MSDQSVEDAKKIVDAEKTKRAQECAKEISEIIKKYNCEFVPSLSVIAKDL